MKQKTPFISINVRPRVFVVDDDLEHCARIATLMNSVSLPVETFQSALAFLDAYDPTYPGCLVLDLRMPGMSGLELLRELTAGDDSLPIIMLTGFADVPTTVEAMKCGARDVLEKPCQPQRLIERVQQLLAEDLSRCQLTLDDASTQSGLNSLTPREHEVLQQLMEGFTSKEISRKLQISVRTVDFHRRNILDKMQIDTPLQLARIIHDYRMRHSGAATLK